MLGEEYCSILLSSPSAILQWHSRANGWFAQNDSPQNAQAGKSRERMVVLCLSIRRSNDARESTRKRMDTPSIWTVSGHLEVAWQSRSEVLGRSRQCGISSRHRYMAERYRPHSAGWCCHQRPSTSASRSMQISTHSRSYTWWSREEHAIGEASKMSLVSSSG